MQNLRGRYHRIKNIGTIGPKYPKPRVAHLIQFQLYSGRWVMRQMSPANRDFVAPTALLCEHSADVRAGCLRSVQCWGDNDRRLQGNADDKE